MDYAYKENNEYVWPAVMRSRFKNVRAWHTLTDEQRAEHGWYPIRYINKEYDLALQKRSLVSATLVDYEFVVTYSVRDLSVIELVEIKRKRITADFENAVAEVKSGYSEEEIKSWDKQEREARQLQAQPNSSTPLLSAMVTSLPVTREAMADKVIFKANAFADVYGKALGSMQAKQDALNKIDLSANDAIEQIQAI